MSTNIDNIKTICNQYEPSRVFGTGIKFLKTRYFEKEEGKQFMRMSCICSPVKLTNNKQLSAAIQYRYHLSVPMPSVALGSVKTLKIRVSY